MFYVYYGYKVSLWLTLAQARPHHHPTALLIPHRTPSQGRELDEKVNSFSRLRKKDGEIDFSEFLELMDEIGLTPVIGDMDQVLARACRNIAYTRNLPRVHTDD